MATVLIIGAGGVSCSLSWQEDLELTAMEIWGVSGVAAQPIYVVEVLAE